MSAMAGTRAGSGAGAAGSRAGSTAGSTRGTRLVVAWLAGLVAVVVVLFVLLPSSPPPYAITSEEVDGTDILRRVLADLDVDMVEGPATRLAADLDPADVAVVFVDRLSDADEEALAAHRAAGGALVIADPRSALAAGPGGGGGAGGAADATGLEVEPGIGVSGPPGCDLLPERMDVALSVDGFAGIGPGDVPDLVAVPDTAAVACWEQDGLALVVQEAGPVVADGPSDDPETSTTRSGTITVVADADVLVNGAIMAQPTLGQFANLFVPRDPDGRVVVLVGDQAPPAGTGVPGAPPPSLVDGMWLAGMALALYALARARRHGRVLTEAPPVEVPASELAVGIAELLQRHGEVGSAAARLRAELRAQVGPRVGAGAGGGGGAGAGAGEGAGAGGAGLVDPVVAATGLDRATVDVALRDQPVGDTESLLDVAAAGRRVRAAVLDDASAPPRAPPGSGQPRGAGPAS